MEIEKQQYYFVRCVNTETKVFDYEKGSGMSAVPKLYLKGNASALAGLRNKWIKKTNSPELFKWEIVPVTISIGEPI
jgi:hypothetical protein